MFKDSQVNLGLSGFDIETEVHICSTVENIPLVHNSVFEAVINGMDDSDEEEEEEEEED